MAQSSPLIEGAESLERKFENAVNAIPTLKTFQDAWEKAHAKPSKEKPGEREKRLGFVSDSSLKSTGKRKVGGAAKERTSAKRKSTSKSGAKKLVAKR
jgi:hypothetical protein